MDLRSSEEEYSINLISGNTRHFYRPQTKFAKVMFLQVSVILSTGGGACVVAPGGHVWLLGGGGGWVIRGCLGGRGTVGSCGVAPGGQGHAWLLRGACMVAPGGGVCGCSGGVHGFPRGMHGFSGGGMHGFFDEIRSMIGRYASYWNASLFQGKFQSLLGISV